MEDGEGVLSGVQTMAEAMWPHLLTHRGGRGAGSVRKPPRLLNHRLLKGISQRFHGNQTLLISCPKQEITMPNKGKCLSKMQMKPRGIELCCEASSGLAPHT